MQGTSEDPFDLDGKNLRRVLPHIRQNIQLQRNRVRIAAILSLIFLVIGLFGFRVSWSVSRLFCGTLLMLTPFELFWAYGEFRCMKWQQRRLEECERRLRQTAENQPSSSNPHP